MTKYRFAVAALLAVLVVSCSKKASGEDAATPAGQQDDDAKQCESNLDCGKGYVCSFDDTRSRVVRYCVEE
jgi:hypothetical protein